MTMKAVNKMKKHFFTLEFEVTMRPENMPPRLRLEYESQTDEEKVLRAKISALKILDNYLTEMNQNESFARLDVLFPATTQRS